MAQRWTLAQIYKSVDAEWFNSQWEKAPPAAEASDLFEEFRRILKQ